jgi:hypothetical protein
LQETSNKKTALEIMKKELKNGKSLKETNFQIDYLLSNQQNQHDYIISILKDTQNFKTANMNL